MKFTELGLSAPLQKAVAAQGYDQPSPIQEQAIPAVLSGKDVMAAAQTGTGKTAGFTLPILERLSGGQPARFNSVRALILTPTRELAAQVEASVVTYGKHLNLRSTVVFGGVKINPQMQRLRRGVDILVATPGRLLDLYSQNAVRFDDLEVLVLDEADRMLDMGFIHDIKRILKLLPNKRQNLMFSATFSTEIRQLAKTITHHPVEISIRPEVTTAEKVAQKIHPVDKKRKKELLLHLIADGQWQQVLVFSRTKHGANKLTDYLNKFGVTALAIHGNKSQGARTRALAQFKQGEIRVLVATDIAARGIDIDLLPHVVNVDLPNVPEDYVHRIGRTGRAGAAGEAVSLVSADEYQQLFDIEKLLGHPLQREFVDDFEPIHDVPVSKQAMRANNSMAKAPGKRRQKPGKKANHQQDKSPIQESGQPNKKIKKPKKRPFVKAAVKEKWANRTAEENQAARERSRKAKQGNKPFSAKDDADDNRGNQRKPFKGKKPGQGQRSGQQSRSGKGGYQGQARSSGQRSGKPGGNHKGNSNRSANNQSSRRRSAGK
jgi:ATP-dependent RNA helicase RhlE